MLDDVLYCCFLQARAKEAEAERRRKRARDDYASFLRHAKGLTPETPWDLFFSTFEKEPELKAVRGRGRLILHALCKASVL